MGIKRSIYLRSNYICSRRCCQYEETLLENKFQEILYKYIKKKSERQKKERCNTKKRKITPPPLFFGGGVPQKRARKKTKKKRNMNITRRKQTLNK